MTLYFIRHGESEANANGLTAGQSESPLTEKGRKQAHVAAQQLRARNITIDTIISSPLSRAYDTAAIIATELAYGADIIINPLIIERSLGLIEGESVSALHELSDDGAMEAGVETDAAVRTRVSQMISELQSLPAGNTLLVSHSGFGRRLIAYIKGVNVAEVPKLANADMIALCSMQQLETIAATPVSAES